MKKLSIILASTLVVIAWGCSEGTRDTPRPSYMPDMGESRAYETYQSTAILDSHGINYTRKPVPGTVKRGEVFPFPLPKDAPGDSVNYNLSKQVANPLPALNPVQMKEAERLYLVNCGICHGQKLDGNGPLYNGGNGPYAAAPRNLISDPVVANMPDGQMFYSITYGKGQMGPYGPQLTTSQRWMIVHYINAQQAGDKGGEEGKGGSAQPDSANAATQATAATRN